MQQVQLLSQQPIQWHLFIVTIGVHLGSVLGPLFTIVMSVSGI